MFLEFFVDSDCKYCTIREVIKNEFNISSRLLTILRYEKRIYLNKQVSHLDKILSPGDYILVDLDFNEENNNIVPTEMELNIIYEDDYYLVINKPSGIPTHPSCLYYKTSLANGIKYYFDVIGLKRKIRAVNRLDKDTSGLVLFAKNQYIHDALSKQMISKAFKKEYLAILDGILAQKTGTISAPIKRKENSIIERVVSNDGDASITHFECIKIFSNYSLVRFYLETGRTHQIRVHSAFIGNPVFGDSLYGTRSNLINRHALHASKISFIHPIIKENVVYNAPLPEDMKKLIL